MKKCVFVYNPESGKKYLFGSQFKNYEKIFKKHDYEPTFIPTQKRGDATRIVKELDSSVDLVIIAGGDGTVNEGIYGNISRKKPLLLGIIPVGTMNDVGNMLGYGVNPDRNLELLLTGVTKNIDVCLVNKRPFIYVACIGKYVDISYATPRNLKKKFGKLGYLLYGLNEVGKDLSFYDINYKINGVEYMGKYSFIFMTNSNRVAGVNNIYPDVKLDDNMFEVALCNIKNKKELIKAVGLLFTQGITDVPGITFYKTDNFEIEFNEKMKSSWCIDGEELEDKSGKYVFEVNKSMNMLLPQKNSNKLFKD